MKKILYPNRFIGFILFNLGFGLLIFVFINNLEESILTYISYALSTYSLVIFCIWLYKICRSIIGKIKNTKLYKLYNKNIKLTLVLSLIFNLIYGIFKLIIGVYYKSWWFITLAIYYLLLCIMKVSLVNNDLYSSSNSAYKKLRTTGIILLLFNIILIGIIILIITENEVINYNGWLIYIVAMYDFYLIILSIINVFKYRKRNSPILIASKCINLTVAMVSMISLEVAMISEFGSNDTSFKLIVTGSSGFVICIINTFISIYMINKSNIN